MEDPPFAQQIMHALCQFPVLPRDRRSDVADVKVGIKIEMFIKAALPRESLELSGIERSEHVGVVDVVDEVDENVVRILVLVTCNLGVAIPDNSVFIRGFILH